ncbi:Protein kinase C signaling pathway involved MAPKK protein [Nowakowskiella sp. JEL0407]|nr:Protein kinase C signaling pathway involved MAPKK protein [Nowakowskiella sp. JEL0407]
MDLLKGLEYIHRTGLIHNDIKSASNLIKNGQAKYCDFGLSFCPWPEKWYPVYHRSGTANYFAPEKVLVEMNGFFGDVWSVGIKADFKLNEAPDHFVSLHGIPRKLIKFLLEEPCEEPGRTLRHWFPRLDWDVNEMGIERSLRREEKDGSWTWLIPVEAARLIQAALTVDRFERPTAKNLVVYGQSLWSRRPDVQLIDADAFGKTKLRMEQILELRRQQKETPALKISTNNLISLQMDETAVELFENIPSPAQEPEFEGIECKAFRKQCADLSSQLLEVQEALEKLQKAVTEAQMKNVLEEAPTQTMVEESISEGG